MSFCPQLIVTTKIFINPKAYCIIFDHLMIDNLMQISKDQHDQNFTEKPVVYSTSLLIVYTFLIIKMIF